ncbi:hypothetical protein K3495_g201 [Podosphaera aphanis]|nr:hypothetical protein K3495_g201 [Podosphaera aphanis]
MSLYGSPDIQEPQPSKAPQACTSCRKQKRKCSKSLPSCDLCQRMKRPCDYSDTAPAPTAEDFNALRIKLADLEAKLSGKNKGAAQTYGVHSGDLVSGNPDQAVSIGQPQHMGLFPSPPDIPWLGIQNRFPGIAFLDSFAFSTGGYVY